jgi:diguanylate cyclase (GGDEF)-like protein/PAS domain S-box-containing protein
MRAWRRLILAAIAALALGTLATAAVVARQESRSADREKREQAARAGADLQSRLALSLQALSTVQGLFAASQKVTGDEFDSFARTLLANSPFSSTFLVTRVPAPLRRAFEQSPGSSPIAEDLGGVLARAGQRPEYYPVSYRYSPVPGYAEKLPVGLDLNADPVRGPALRAARDRGSAQATRPVELSESGRRGLLLFLPIYSPGAPTATVAQRRGALKALAVSSFEATRLGDAVKTSRGPDASLQIFDGSRKIYGPPRVLEDAASAGVRAAGRNWTVLVKTPVQASMELPVTILAGGLALTLSVALLLVGLGRRERYAQQLSDRRLAERETAEGARHAAEERFQRAFEDSGVGMALTDAQGARLLEVNDALCALTGYSRQRLLELDPSRLAHPDDRDATATEVEDGDTTQAERRLRDAQGQPIWVLQSTSIVRDQNGHATHRIVQVQDLSERKRYEGELEYLADHDPLTGLFNRRRFEEELSTAFAGARREGDSGAVVALDLDHFKYTNDSLGHSVGDQLIARVSGLLSERLGPREVLARLGGDEFAVLIPTADRARAEEVAEDLRLTIRTGAVVAGERGQVGTTASFGIALFGGDAGNPTADELLAEADIAMYDAKEAGRDRWAVFSPASRGTGMAGRLGWVERIREALTHDRFVLHGQPIESLKDDPRPRYELLLRMLGDKDELLPPAAFLHVAERFDLIQEIDRWVVGQAIDLLAELQASGVEAVMEVNVSAKSVTDPALAELLRSRLEESRIDPSGLVFEMTETAAIVNLERAKDFGGLVRELGCEFALDDFGAGFASFHYLKHFAFDYLKIDGEFIEHLPQSQVNRVLVQSLVDIARGLNKQTIAEFVEDEPTRVLLQQLGVDYAQGFHVGRPAPISAQEVTDGLRTAAH